MYKLKIKFTNYILLNINKLYKISIIFFEIYQNYQTESYKNPSVIKKIQRAKILNTDYVNI
ncbi:hypothetical protein CMU89_16775 [Elizabethkingia anophelis]|nr:hypothetical protein BBD30_10475 [Elizabethkingia anophelis]MCW2462738.1 hypothetical protein [Elizabethkingia anophelis]MCW2466423.1 hypothetical protein [Elizabethkingia anophelis]MCW2470107.1 hypothetical protein [Elizabethkingia anophelis]MDV3509023.1 hypothetical protein [Elizabethkingia anophelis]